MNNKAELQKKLADLKAEIEQTEKLLAEPEVPTVKGLVEKYQPICFFDTESNIHSATFLGSGCYIDSETAEREALRCQFLLVAHHVNEGWEWDGKTEYCGVRYSAICGIFFGNSCNSPHTFSCGEVPFKSIEAVRLAIDIFGQERLKKMNGIK